MSIDQLEQIRAIACAVFVFMNMGLIATPIIVYYDCYKPKYITKSEWYMFITILISFTLFIDWLLCDIGRIITNITGGW